jgi:plastocyanin
MRGRRSIPWVAAAAGLILATYAAPAAAQSSEPSVNVNAEGNPFTGGLRFNPDAVSVGFGRTVQWTNTDFLVPHTATEEHGLWDLGGEYGVPGVSPTGFGPGEVVERKFEAGTHRYHCKVHPDMKGTVSVPVDLRLFGLRQRATRTHQLPRVVRYVTATWAVEAPARGLAFDVQLHRGEAAWKTVRDGTRQTGMIFRAGERGTRWEVRVRLRKADDARAATEWSPAVAIVSDQAPPNRKPRKRRG